MPATQPRFHEKADQSAADVVFLDLEDSVAPEAKAASRASVVWALQELGRVAAAQQDWQAARTYVEECVSICRDLGFDPSAGETLEQLRRVCVHDEAIQAAWEEGRSTLREKTVADALEGDL